jgi:predicted lipoprotein
MVGLKSGPGSVHRITSRFLVVGLLLSFLVTACTVVPISQNGSQASAAGSSSGGSFNAASYVDSVWASKVVPTVVEKAVDIDTLTSALKQDQATASKKFGVEVNGQYHFMVKGTGKVTKVDTSGVNGLMTVDTSSGPVQIQVGPLITGESLRDAVGLFNFGDFTNQIQYGAVNEELNNRAAKDVTSEINLNNIQGKNIQFYGTFTLGDLSQIMITPVKITEQGG